MKISPFLISAGIFFGCLACINSEPDLAKKEYPTRGDPYLLPTPDSIAFASGQVKCGINSYRYKYCGYASAQKDSSDWIVLPSLHRLITLPPFKRLKIETDSSFGSLTLFVFPANGSPLASLTFSTFKLQKGIYLPIKEPFPTYFLDFHISYRDIDGGCSSFNWYTPDSTKVSFLQVIDYDSTKKELKARFRVYMKLQQANKPGYPKTLFFDDGLVFARSVN